MSATLHHTEGEREAFDAWAKSCPWVEFSDYAWQAWQARAALAPKTALSYFADDVEAAMAQGQVLVTERVPADRFENAIRKFGVVAACEWFGHSPDSEFTHETMRVLAERAAFAPNQGEAS